MSELADAIIVAPIVGAMIVAVLSTPKIKTTPIHLRVQPPPLRRTQ